MVTLKNKQFLINGKPQLILSGEIHYFRLKKSQWQKAIDELKACGCNTVASYIPWFCHEFEEGKFDFSGKYHEENDLQSFLKLCKENDLFFIARPGPFIMAEVKNEGIPYWVFEHYPEVYPHTWDNRRSSNTSCDYLHPDFLACAEKWYAQVMPLLSEYLPENGGNLIGVQLDNEIGMLAWVSNCPDLTDCSLSLFIDWLNKKYGEKVIDRYGKILTSDADTFSLLRSPKEDITLSYHQDLGHFMRYRFAEYIRKLKSFAEKSGIHNIPFMVNIHGSGDRIGSGYPIGLSQLMETYQNCTDIMSASDFYIGDVHIGNYSGIYLANAFTECLNSEHQPLASMEFEAGDGNYGDNYDVRYSPSSIDIKSRLFTAQGNKLLNYYLLTGGENYRFAPSKNDGNDRIAFTGQKHGFAAPLDPYLNHNTTYSMTRDVISLLRANEEKLADMTLETDPVTLAFIPDYYMTEYHYPNSQKEESMIEEIRSVRDRGYYTVLAKSLLMAQYNFKALDIQNHNILDSIGTDTTLAIASCLYLSKDIQQNICEFIRAGGNVFIYGRLPIYDMEGNPCTLLMDCLGAHHNGILGEKFHYYCSVYPCGFASEYPETRSFTGQSISIDEGEVFLRHYGTDDICGFRKEIGKSKVVCILTEYHCQMPVMEELFSYLGINKQYSNTAPFYGMFVLSTKNQKEERFLHILNVDDFEKEFDLSEKDTLLFPHKLTVKAKQCLMLPIGLKVIPHVTIVRSTAEISKKGSDSVTFRLTQKTDRILLKTDKAISVSHPCEINCSEQGTEIIVKQGMIESEKITVLFS